MSAQDFQFDHGVAEVFDDMLGRSVPFYAEIQRMTAELASRFARPGTSVVDIGCSTGETLSVLAQALPDPSVRLVGIDFSPHMLARAKEKLGQAGVLDRCRLEEGDINDGLSESGVSVAVLNWTLQFVRPLQRDAVVRSIYEKLVPQGCLILMEKVLSSESLLSRLYIDCYYDFKKRNGYSQNEIADKRERLENVLVPYRVEENQTLLSRNGFEVVDIFFRWYNWAGYLAIKRPPETGG